MFIFTTLFILISLTLLNEFYLVKPTLFIKPRCISAIIIHCFATLFVFITLFIISHRVIFSAMITLGLHFLITAINQAKYQALKEGMVFSDIVMFSQAFKHPRLYFPFVKTWLLISFTILIIAILGLGLQLESPLYLTSGLPDSLFCLLINLGLFFTLYPLAKKQPLSLVANQDIKALGLLASMTVGLLKSWQKINRQIFNNLLKQTPFSSDSFQDNFCGSDLSRPHKLKKMPLSDLIVIQSESFFDVRRLYPAISKTILQNYDQAKSEACYFGELNVCAWGANTMRTEFSFLSGLENAQLGLFRYYPYYYIKTEVISMATYLKQHGYYTVCIHPYQADFFERRRVFNLLGFDEFIDVNSFSNAAVEGAYISDAAVTEKIIQLQNNIDKPLFVFAITMENHGPLHLETISRQDEIKVYQDIPTFDSHDLTVYLRHLKNADQMIADLISHFKQQQKPTGLCFYGDHVPSIPAAYQALQFENSQSDYFIWQSKTENGNAKYQAINVNQLGILLTRFSRLPT